MGPRDETGIALVWLFSWLHERKLPTEFTWSRYSTMDERVVQRKLRLIAPGPSGVYFKESPP